MLDCTVGDATALVTSPENWSLIVIIDAASLESINSDVSLPIACLGVVNSV